MENNIVSLATILGVKLNMTEDGFPLAYFGTDGDTCPNCGQLAEKLKALGVRGVRVHCRPYNAAVPEKRGQRSETEARQHKGYKHAHGAAAHACAGDAVRSVRIVPASWPAAWKDKASASVWVKAVEDVLFRAGASDSPAAVLATGLNALVATDGIAPFKGAGRESNGTTSERAPTEMLHPVKGVHRVLSAVEAFREAMANASDFYGYTLAGSESVIAPHRAVYGEAILAAVKASECLKALPADWQCEAPEREVCVGDLFSLDFNSACDLLSDKGSDLPDGTYRVVHKCDGAEYLIRACAEDGSPVESPAAYRATKGDLGRRGYFKFLRTVEPKAEAPKAEAPKLHYRREDATGVVFACIPARDGWVLLSYPLGEKPRKEMVKVLPDWPECEATEAPEFVRVTASRMAK